MTISPERVVALTITHARKLLTAGFIARLVEDTTAEADLRAAFARTVNLIPSPLRMSNGDERRVAEPARRRMLRVGVLASRDWAATALEPKGTP